MKSKGARIAKTVLQKNNNNMGGLTPPYFKICCKALLYSKQRGYGEETDADQ